jgi:hypothetical protein
MSAKRETDLILVVRGDHNDADFVTKATPITQADLDRFLPLIEAIKAYPRSENYAGPHNWPVGEYGCREDLGDLGDQPLAVAYGELGELAEEFDETYVPHGEGWNLHSIYEIYVVRFEKKLLGEGSWQTV